MAPSADPDVTIRRAVPDDAAAIVGIFEVVAAERIHSAIDRAWTIDTERRYLASLSPRECVHVAVEPGGRVVGVQVLDRWSSYLESMAHVGQAGTFVLPEWRGRRVGHLLWASTEAFAREAGYRKLVIQVRGSNLAAQGFYRQLGFRDCGLLTGQVIIDGVDDDEVLLELFLPR
jgi:ribosomal protein S18 acetylase RimI-like enzyme